MILEMARVRLLGPRPLLADTLRAIQDEGIVQLAEANRAEGFVPCAADPLVRRRRHHLGRALARVEDALALLATFGAPLPGRDVAAPSAGRAARLAARVLAEANRLAARRRALAEERDGLRTYEPLFVDLEAVLGDQARRHVSIYLLRLRTQIAVAELRAALSGTLRAEFELRSHQLPSGETVVLLLVSAARADELERQLAAAHVERAPLPAALGNASLADALPRMRPRLAEVNRELELVRGDATALARAHGDELTAARRTLHDALLVLDGEEQAAATARVFAVEGWLPARDRSRLAAAIARKVGPLVSIEEVDRHEWSADDAPVKLANPRFLAPFEILTSLLPLPLYG